jgi:hypothetical protein
MPRQTLARGIAYYAYAFTTQMDHRSCYYREGSAEENVQKMLNWKDLNFLLEGESYAGDESAFWHFSASERIEYCRQCLSIFPATFYSVQTSTRLLCTWY